MVLDFKGLGLGRGGLGLEWPGLSLISVLDDEVSVSDDEAETPSLQHSVNTVHSQRTHRITEISEKSLQTCVQVFNLNLKVKKIKKTKTHKKGKNAQDDLIIKANVIPLNIIKGFLMSLLL